MSAVIAEQRTAYEVGEGSKAVELTPGQLLERLGFTSAQLSHPGEGPLAAARSGGCSCCSSCSSEPNVLILDEPTNDLDTDMLAAIEDLLDSWPGTLLVVSHDRYLVERVTDQQYAILDGHLRHLPARRRGVPRAAPAAVGCRGRRRLDRGVASDRGRRCGTGRGRGRRRGRRRECGGRRGRGCRGRRHLDIREHCAHRCRPSHRREGALIDRPPAREAAGADRGAAREARPARPGRLRGTRGPRRRARRAGGIRRPSSRPGGSRCRRRSRAEAGPIMPSCR